MAKPKLALIPAAQGTKLYSVLPSDGTGDFDFTRGSVATRINAQGLIENVASGQSRLDYPLIDGVQKGCPHHILEPARTNILSYSEDFSNSFWNKGGSSIISNTSISPDGGLNADKLVQDTSSGVHKIVKPYTGISGTNTCSIFVKPDGVTKIGISSTESVSVLSSFDLSNGTLISSLSDDYSITSFADGWFRISSTDIGGNRKMAVFLLDDTANYSYQGDGVSGLYIYGAMLEAGSYATSYIPTSGTAVTRSAETATGAGNSTTFNDSEGVLMAEISALADDGTNRFISISDGTINNRINIVFDTSNNINARQAPGNVNISTTGVNILNSNKIAYEYQSGSQELWVNGFKIGTTSVSTLPSGLDRLNFDSFNGGDDMYCKTKQLQYFDSILADTQLEQLTSWQSFRDMANGQLYTIE